MHRSLCDYGFEALTSSDPLHKVRLTEQVKDLWAKGDITEVGNIEPPDAPSRPALPLLREKKETPGPKQGWFIAIIIIWLFFIQIHLIHIFNNRACSWCCTKYLFITFIGTHRGLFIWPSNEG